MIMMYMYLVYLNPSNFIVTKFHKFKNLKKEREFCNCSLKTKPITFLKAQIQYTNFHFQKSYEI